MALLRSNYFKDRLLYCQSESKAQCKLKSLLHQDIYNEKVQVKTLSVFEDQVMLDIYNSMLQQVHCIDIPHVVQQWLQSFQSKVQMIFQLLKDWLLIIEAASLLSQFIIYYCQCTMTLHEERILQLYLSASIIIMILKLGFPKLLKRQAFKFSSKKLNLDNYDSFPLETYDIGQRLDRYLKNTSIGWISAQKYLREHEIIVLKNDGTLTYENNYRIQQGDKLMIRKGKEIEQHLIGKKNIDYIQMDEAKVQEKIKSMTIFDNQNITILNKLPGYSVQGDSDPHFNMFSLMASRFKKDMIYISHRLDKPTTGLVFISKNLATAQLLGEALESRSGINKYYFALSEGRQITQKVGTISCQMEWTSKHKARITEYLSKEGDSQLAITNYLVMKEKKLSDILWRNFIGMKIITGRKHQIRCQLSQHLLNPIINDELYLGRKVADIGQAIYLHAFGLKITSKPLIEQVFKLNNESGVILDNQKGFIKIINGEMYVYAKLAKHWEHHPSLIRNDQLEQILNKIENGQIYPKTPNVIRLR